LSKGGNPVLNPGFGVVRFGLRAAKKTMGNNYIVVVVVVVRSLREGLNLYIMNSKDKYQEKIHGGVYLSHR
jgi:hypothetical protein